MNDLPVITPSAKAQLKSLPKDTIVLLNEMGDTDHGCPNCGGRKVIIFTILGNDKSSFPPVVTASKFWDGFFHPIADHIICECPLCSSGDQIELRAYLKSRSGLLENEFDWRIDYIRDRPGKEHALIYAGQILSELPMPKGFILFFGGYGVGKTGILKSLVASAIAVGISAHYTTSAQMLDAFRAEYNGNPAPDYAGFRLLALDEVDVISNTEWSIAQVREIIDKRYASRFLNATIFATNQAPEKVWPYLASRLEDGIKVPVGGESLRGQ
jgi:hypothetical protein